MDDFRSNPSHTQPPPRAEAVAEAVSQGGRSPHGAEKRRNMRYAVCADATIVEVLSSTRLQGRAADLSLGGCYLDGINLFPVAASVRLRLTTETHMFECEARVTFSVPGMGMGLVFTKTSSEQATELRNWIAELSGDATPPVTPELRFDRRRRADPEDFAKWHSAVTELVTLLRCKGLLDESETASLRNKLAR